MRALQAVACWGSIKKSAHDDEHMNESTVICSTKGISAVSADLGLIQYLQKTKASFLTRATEFLLIKQLGQKFWITLYFLPEDQHFSCSDFLK